MRMRMRAEEPCTDCWSQPCAAHLPYAPLHPTAPTPRPAPPRTLLAGLHTLDLPANELKRLPPALFQATRLSSLQLSGNRGLGASIEELRQLLRTMPRLQLLFWDNTGLLPQTAEALMEAAAGIHGLEIELPDYELLAGSWASSRPEPLVSLEAWLASHGGHSYSPLPSDTEDDWGSDGDW